MQIFSRMRRRMRRVAPQARKPIRPTDQFTALAAGIASSQARLLMIAERVAAGRGEPGDERRLRIQRELVEGYRRRLDTMTLPVGTGDDAEAWLRAGAADITLPSSKRSERGPALPHAGSRAEHIRD